jgi:hypothetical protein
MKENKAFRDEIRDLVDRKFQKFNANFSRLQQDLEDALDKNGVTILGFHLNIDGSLGSDIVNDLNRLKDELNKVDLRFEWEDLNIEKIYGWLTAKQKNAPMSVSLITASI